MSEEQPEKKDPIPASTTQSPSTPASTTATTRPSTTPITTGSRPVTAPPARPVVQPVTAKRVQPSLSRRAFLAGAIGVSGVLTLAAFATSSGFLNPLIPPPEMENSVPQHTITDWTTLDNNYKNQVALHPGQPLDPIDAINNGKNAFASFFYWPYDSSTSPYYKDVLVRLPDTNPDGSPLLATPDSKIFTAPNGARFVAFNTTCVHLRCLVNPGNPVANEYRLLCPCHGSQYRLVDGIPVAGPAYDLGLKPLPQVNLDFSKGNNTVVAVIWGRNPDGSPIFLNGVPGIGRG